MDRQPETVETGEPDRGRWIGEVVREGAEVEPGRMKKQTENEEAEEIWLKQMMLMDKKMAS